MTNFENKYSALKKKIDRKLRTFVKKNEPNDLYLPSKYILSSGGKRIRGVLLLLVNEMCSGISKKYINFAAAVEVLHLFTLVHDDIMDDADKRRGKETVHIKWDLGTAILTGDILVGLAFDLLIKEKVKNSSNIIEVFNNAIIEVCEGQAIDKAFEKNKNINLNDYYKMIEKKTGKLIEASALIGAFLGRSNPVQLKAIHKFGRYIGRAFQIQDDLLDIAGSESEIGKNIYNDIRSRKKTYFYAKAQEIFTSDDLIKYNSIYNNYTNQNSELTLILDFYKKYDLIKIAECEVSELVRKAKKSILIFEEKRRNNLNKFADMMQVRKF